MNLTNNAVRFLVSVLSVSRVGQRIGTAWEQSGGLFQPLFGMYSKRPHLSMWSSVFALLIFPGSRPPSIVSANELIFCVRDGNRWSRIAINTNLCGWLLTIVISKAFQLLIAW